MAEKHTVNAERGEVGIKLDGVVYPMRPSWRAMQAIEDDLGPILALSQRLRDPLQSLRVREMGGYTHDPRCRQGTGR